jgi:tyrosine-protein phosphatase YwqE
MPIHAAAEYLVDANFVTLFKNEPLITLKENYILVELNYINPLIQIYDILFELQVAGYKPILAHPERYSYYHHNFNEYQKLKNAGCLFQLNLLSTVGYYGSKTTKIAEQLLNKGMIDFIGSDVHHENHINAFSKKLLVKDLKPLKNAIIQNQFFRF